MNFLDTQRDFLDNDNALKSVKNVINKKHNLGSGSKLEVYIRRSDTSIEISTTVHGVTDINKMNPSALNKLMRVKKEIDDWVEGKRPDFPDIANL